MDTPKVKTIISYHLIRDELLSRGYSAELLGLSRRMTRFVSPKGAVWMTCNATLAYPFVDYAVHKLTADKQLSYEFAELHGMAVPKTLCMSEVSEEAHLFLDEHAPIVVKPLSSFGSRGLALNVKTISQLLTAIISAREFSEQVLLQRQVTGDEIRLTVIEGRVESVIMRQTPRVTGDGSSTVAELIAKENEARAQLPTDCIVYPQLDKALIPERYLTDTTVLSEGTMLELNKSTLARGGASMCEITEEVHPDYIRAAEMLAEKINPAFLVVDMMVHDYRLPLTKENCAFIEFNTAPSLRLYYGVRSGRQYDIVKRLADMIEQRIH